MKKFTLLLVSTLAVSTSLTAFADDGYEVVVTGYSGSPPTSGEGYERYLDAMAAQNQSSPSSNTGGGGSSGTPPPPSKPIKCANDMKYLDATYSNCQANTYDAAAALNQECNSITDSRGVAGCLAGIPYKISAGLARCDADKAQTIADCK